MSLSGGLASTASADPRVRLQWVRSGAIPKDEVLERLGRDVLYGERRPKTTNAGQSRPQCGDAR